MRRQKGHPPVVYFVDDNFIGNRKAAKDMLPHLIAWQKQHGYPLQFACEATLNIAKQPEILALMREASLRRPVRRHRDAGGRRAQGHAQGPERRRADDGVDQDAQRLRAGGHLRHHPRPRYRLRRHRGAAEGLHRRLADPDADHQSAAGAAEDAAVGPAQGGGTAVGRSALESNVRFLRPYDEVVAMWRRCIAYANDPERLFAALPPPGRLRPM